MTKRALAKTIEWCALLTNNRLFLSMISGRNPQYSLLPFAVLKSLYGTETIWCFFFQKFNIY